jgi:hypothetical protein
VGFRGKKLAPLIIYLEIKWKRVVKFKPRPALPQDWTPLPIVLEAIWVPEVALMFWGWKETLARTGTRTPDLSASNVVAILNTLLRIDYIN